LQELSGLLKKRGNPQKTPLRHSHGFASVFMEARPFGGHLRGHRFGRLGSSKVLTDLACRKAAPKDKEYRLGDSLGLYLLVLTSGHKSWRMGYWFAGKKKRLVLGSYPDMSIADARAERDAARKLVAQGIDPVVRKKQDAAARFVDAGVTFKLLGDRFLEERKATWARRYYETVESIFRNYFYLHWAALPFSQITRPMIAERLKAIEASGKRETAMRARQKINELREWALDLGYELHSAGNVHAGLRGGVTIKRPAITDLQALRDMLRKVEAAPAHPVTRLCSRLLALTAMRPGTVQQLPWAELKGLDREEPVWTIAAARMKLTKERKQLTEFDQLVPLARQALDVIDCMRGLSGEGEYVFPSIKSRRQPISDSTLSKLYRDNGFRDLHVPHGWRSSFSTIMNERAMKAQNAGDRVVIDLMLGHVQEGVEPIYNRAAYMDRRRALAQEWADLLLEGMPSAAELLQGPRR
jgi:integrase